MRRVRSGPLRDRIGLVFEAINLVPTRAAIENITPQMDIAGRSPLPLAETGRPSPDTTVTDKE